MDVKMLIVQGRARGKHLCFPPGEFLFGRDPHCHVRPNSPWVSRQHCLLRIGPEGVHVRDLGSTNGTLVNGARLSGECALEPGDKLQVGPLVLQRVADVPAATEMETVAPAAPVAGDRTNVLTSDTLDLQLPDGGPLMPPGAGPAAPG
jgi:predicted component of type VI protein secretion system